MTKPTLRQLNPKDFAAQDIGLFTLQNAHGSFVQVCNYGARVVQIAMPDRTGTLGDVALGFNSLAQLQLPSPQGVPSMGAFIGRYANRIAQRRFELDGQTYTLLPNSGAHSIHGGPAGSRYQIFKVQAHTQDTLVLSHEFMPHMDGFPGRLQLTVTYHLSAAQALHIRWAAHAVDAPTVGSFTSHAFFNLTGDPQRTVLEHQLQLHASHYLPLKVDQAPTGDLLAVHGTPFDFTQQRQLGYGLAQAQLQANEQLALCGGYDHHFAVDGWHTSAGKPILQTVAQAHEPSSGRSLTVRSTEPGVQLFTANGLDAAQCGFARHSGLCLEPSYFPDSPNQAQFPSTRIAAGQTREGEIVYQFGVI